MRALTATNLDPGAFAPFGDVLRFDAAAAKPANAGTALRSDTGAGLASSGGSPVMAIYRCSPQPLPLRIGLLEHHPRSSQAFLALTVPRFLVVVAPARPDGLPDGAAASAFIGVAGQGINYAPGVWHAPMVALDREGDFLMMMWQSGTAADCAEHRLADPLLVTA